MMKRLPFLLLAALLLLQFPAARASHFLGGDLTYEALGNNRYKLALTVFRDCSGVSVYTTATFVCRSTGCTTTGTGAITSVAPLLNSTIGTPYCPGAPGGAAPCGAGLPVNTEMARYETIVTLPPAAEWRISVQDNARPDLANINGNTDIYYEATLSNMGNGQTFQNHSPVFATNAVQFVGWNLPTTFSHLAYDTDGDSLVYSLERPLMSCGSPNVYNQFNAGATYISLPTTGAPCVATLPASLTTYSPTFPLPSLAFTGACPVKTAVPSFLFNPAMGSMSFTPVLFTPGNTTMLQAQNKYVVVVKVDEYRRQPGNTYFHIGSVRREMVFVVSDCGSNVNPSLGPVTIGGTSQQASAVIPVTAGRLISLNLSGIDSNPNQVITLTSNAEQMLPNSEFTPSAPSAQPTAQLNWLPPTTLRPGLYYCTVSTTDNACPIKGVTQQTLTFRVTNTTLATSTAKAVTTLAAVPTPFSGQVSFQLAQAGVQTVTIFDRLGRQVATLRSSAAGEVKWQPAASVAPGLYLARTADGRQVARLLRSDTE
ncbi:hypothetical protein [Hymenobacter sediminicola]|uniref:T9SS type A sorting domain-containing protein n=1 Tax=Hymenobacter sediminicola TaxID=2761579 RepID=A0A7G7W8F9_9BACT|nr:hypothetical protein [Hymenobacter sediminicola]QNH62652.1 hypothetical protein H4317_02160 [Hymenobacter sediminicola]